ncbi:MAG: sulfatase [Candidatus Hydrogenedentota bacterium]
MEAKKVMSARVGILTATVVAVALAGCSGPAEKTTQALVAAGAEANFLLPPGSPPHVVFISLDTARPDYLGLYGHPWVKTPNLDELAAESVVFEDAMTPAPTTLAAHTAMMTSTYPHTHGVPRNGFVVSDENVTLAEILRAAGYSTAAIVGAFPLLHRFELDQGFDLYDDKSAHGDFWQRTAEEVTDATLRYVAQRGPGGPLFLFVHYFDAHAPYSPGKVWFNPYREQPVEDPGHPITPDWMEVMTGKKSMGARKYLVQRYAAEITYLDHHLGRLLEGLRQAGIVDNAIIIVTSDHGESLWDNGPWFDHGQNTVQSVIHAVGILRLPGARHGGTRVGVPVSTLDWMPTVLAYAGITAPPGIDGRAIDLNGDAPRVGPRDLFCEATKPFTVEREGEWYNAQKERCIRSENYKFVYSPYANTRALFNVADDPYDHKNLLDAPTPEIEKLAAELEAKLAAWHASAAPKSSAFDQENEQETRDQLEALGYVN